jgi:predicted RNase H-like nuclease (RuvC/YqgF family)
MATEELRSQRLNIEIEHFQKDISDIKTSLTMMSESLQRLTALEERFTAVTQSIATLQRHHESLDERQRKLENEYIYAKATAQTLANTGKIAWALGGGIIMTIITKLLQVFV